MQFIKKEELEEIKVSAVSFAKWVVIALATGIIIGGVGVVFSYCMKAVTDFRAAHPAIIFALPFAGLLIVFVYQVLGNKNDKGTNLVLSSVNSGDALPVKMAPCIFAGTILTHLCGGSAGREGAALQLGGSIASGLGDLIKISDDDKKILTMCGMSACFAALFGTPLAASVFSLEVVSVGVFHYSAMAPCVIAALTAAKVAEFCGLAPEVFHFTGMPEFTFGSAAMICILAVLTGILSIAFCMTLHGAGHFYKEHFKNQYIRVFVGGIIVIVLTLIVGDQRFNGAGMNFIEGFFEEGRVFPPSFLLKIIFTAATLGAGYKGGEIVPTLYTGAAFGTLFAMITGFSPGLCTAVGMTALFCGVTNSPVASLLLAFELFGYHGMPYYLLTVAIADRLSGYYSLYGSQKIMYSKVSTEFLDRKAK